MPASPFFAIYFDPTDGQEIAQHIQHSLQQAGLVSWLDPRRPIPTLDPTLLTDNAIRGAQAVIICLTPNSADSTSVPYHFAHQAQRHAKPVVVVRAADVELPPLLQDRVSVDVISDWDGGVRQLAQNLQDSTMPAVVPVFETDDSDADPDELIDETQRLEYYLEQLQFSLERQLNATVFNLQAWGLEGLASLQSVQSYPFTLADGKSDFDVIFAQHRRRLLLIGGRGTGKTTLAQTFAYRLAWQRRYDLDRPLPFYVPLHSWNGSRELIEWLAARHLLTVHQVAAAIHDGQAVLILDGLNTVRQDLRDEMTDTPLDLRIELIHAINSLLNPEVPLLITGHPSDLAFLQQAVGVEALPAVAEITQLPTKQAQKIGGNAWPTNQPNVEAVLCKPLFLALYCNTFGDTAPEIDNDQELPDIEFDIIDATIQHRYSQLQNHPSAKPQLLLEEIDENITKVLWDLLTGSTRRDYIEIWNDHFEDSLGRKTNETKADLRALGLLVPLTKNVNRLLHADISDYFAYGECQYRLFEGHPGDQVKAATALGRLRNRRATELLLAALDVGSQTVRRQAIDALGYLGDSRAIPTLLRLLKTETGALRMAIVEALGRIQDTRALTDLVNLQDDPEAGVRAAVAWSLGQLKGIATVAPLIALTDDADVDVVLRAIQALGNLGDARAVDALVALLEDAEWEIRFKAVQALAQIGDKSVLSDLMACLYDPDNRVRAAVFRALQVLGDESVVLLLIEALEDEDPGVRQSATESLVALGSVSVEPLLNVLKDNKEEKFFAATQALGQLGDVAFPALIEALREDHVNVRRGAIEALGWLGNPLAVPELLPFLHDHEDQIRINVAWALGTIGDAGAVEGLVTALHDPRKEVVRNAILALEQIGSEQAIDPLQEFYETTSDDELAIVANNALRTLEVQPHGRDGLGLLGG